MRHAFALIAMIATGSCAGVSPAAAPLALEHTIPLRDVAGRIDHLAIDLSHDRLFVAELGNGSVDAIDLGRGTVVHRISGLNKPQGVAWLPARDELAIASGGDGTVRFYHGADLTPAGVIEIGGDADNLRVDPRTGWLVVGYGAGALAAIDPATRKMVARLPLPGHPEGFRLDGGTVLVNVPDARRVISGDLATGAIVATWRGAHLLNFPMALDPTTHLAAIVYRWPARLVTLDAKTGAIGTDLPTCGDADDVFFDAKRDRIIVTCGSGKIELFGGTPGGYRSLGVTETRSGARTALFVPERDRLYLAVRAGNAAGAEIRIYRPTR
jgi:hypothetical protein